MEEFSGNDKFLAMFKEKLEFSCNMYMSRCSNSITNQIYSFLYQFFIREKRFYSLFFMDFYIRNLFPFLFPQKVNTIVPLYSLGLSRNFTFFYCII